jgi:hypothetical protein
LELPSGRYLNPHKIPNDVSPIAHIAAELIAFSTKVEKAADLLKQCSEIVNDDPSPAIIRVKPGTTDISKNTKKRIESLCQLIRDREKRIALLATKADKTWMEPLNCSFENRNTVCEAILYGTLNSCTDMPFSILRYLCYSDCNQHQLFTTPGNLAKSSDKILEYAEMHFSYNGWRWVPSEIFPFGNPNDIRCWPRFMASKWHQPIAMRVDRTDSTVVFQI